MDFRWLVEKKNQSTHFLEQHTVLKHIYFPIKLPRKMWISQDNSKNILLKALTDYVGTWSTQNRRKDLPALEKGSILHEFTIDKDSIFQYWFTCLISLWMHRLTLGTNSMNNILENVVLPSTMASWSTAYISSEFIQFFFSRV